MNIAVTPAAACKLILPTYQNLQYHGDVVGTSGKMHIKTFHSWKDGEATRGNTDGKIPLRLSLRQRPLQQAEWWAALNYLKAKIVKPNNARLARGQMELRTQDILQEESMSLYHLIKRRKGGGSERSQNWGIGVKHCRSLRGIYCVGSVSTFEGNIDWYRLMRTVLWWC